MALQDAILIKQGTGARKLAVFAGTNCGYCKRLEKDLMSLNDVSIYTFVIPILGGDSPEKSNALWCAASPAKAWRDWMIEGKAPEHSGERNTSAIERNLAMSRKHKVRGTPAIVFESGYRASGALPAAEIEKRLASIGSGPATASARTAKP